MAVYGKPNAEIVVALANIDVMGTDVLITKKQPEKVVKKQYFTSPLKEKALEEYPPILHVSDLQEILGISRDTAYKLVHKKGFPARIISPRCIRIDKNELCQWLSTQNLY